MTATSASSATEAAPALKKNGEVYYLMAGDRYMGVSVDKRRIFHLNDLLQFVNDDGQLMWAKVSSFGDRLSNVVCVTTNEDKPKTRFVSYGRIYSHMRSGKLEIVNPSATVITDDFSTMIEKVLAKSL